MPGYVHYCWRCPSLGLTAAVQVQASSGVAGEEMPRAEESTAMSEVEEESGQESDISDGLQDWTRT